MKRFTLVVSCVILGSMLFTQQLYSHSVYVPDGDRLFVELDEQAIKVFPNPSDGRFQLSIDYQGTEKITAKVYDITGKLIRDISEELAREDQAVNSQVDLETPKAGIYFLRVEIGNQVLTKKIIIR
jgi:hypothetical protein